MSTTVDNWTHDFGIGLAPEAWPSDIIAHIPYVEGVGVGESTRSRVMALSGEDQMTAFMNDMRKGYNDYVDGTVDNLNVNAGYTSGLRIAAHSRQFEGQDVALFLHGVLEKFVKGPSLPSYEQLKLRLPSQFVGHRFKKHRRRHHRHHGSHRPPRANFSNPVDDHVYL